MLKNPRLKGCGLFMYVVMNSEIVWVKTWQLIDRSRYFIPINLLPGFENKNIIDLGLNLMYICVAIKSQGQILCGSNNVFIRYCYVMFRAKYNSDIIIGHSLQLQCSKYKKNQPFLQITNIE